MRSRLAGKRLLRNADQRQPLARRGFHPITGARCGDQEVA
jgi:hypothetical protein